MSKTVVEKVGPGNHCATCNKDIVVDDLAVVTRDEDEPDVLYHCHVKCLPEELRAVFDGIHKADQSITPVDRKKATQEEMGYRALARQIEPHLTAQSRLERSYVEDLVKRTLEATAPVRMEIRCHSGEISLEGRHHEEYPTLIQELSMGHAVWLTGPAGSGKTTACINAAKAMCVPVFIQTPVSDKFELLGYEGPDGKFKHTAVTKWCGSDGGMLIFDEIDANDPRVMPSIHAILSGDEIDHAGRKFGPPEGGTFAANANTWGFGANNDYCGRAPLDSATTNRFSSYIDWAYDSVFEAALCQGVAKSFCDLFGPDSIESRLGGNYARMATAVHGLCAGIRDNLKDNKIKLVFGPRDSMAMVKRLCNGIKPEEALRRSAISRLPVASRDKATDGTDEVMDSCTHEFMSLQVEFEEALS